MGYGFVQRVKLLFSWRKLPGHAIWVLGGGWKLLDIGGRLDLLSRMVESIGGTPAVLASALVSPWASVALITVGIGYVVLIGEPQKGAQRHPWWPYVGWTVFAATLVSMLGIAGYGATEIYIRQEIDKGIMGIPRNTPDSPARSQRPAYTNSRQLTPDQVRILLVELDRIKSLIREVTIGITPHDTEVVMLRMQFEEILRRVGIGVVLGEQYPRGLDDVGIMLAVKDVTKPPIEAQKFMEALTVANISARYTDYDLNPNRPFTLFIAPRPLN
jgi:hypothetical protein